MADTVRINGNMHSFASVILKIDGERWYGFTKIDYSEKRTRAKVYGMGRHFGPRGRTRGKYEPGPLTLGIPTGSLAALLDTLASKDPSAANSYGNAEVTISIQYIEEGDRPMTVEALRCALVEHKTSADEGSEGGVIADVTFDAFDYRINGKTLYDGSNR